MKLLSASLIVTIAVATYYKSIVCSSLDTRLSSSDSEANYSSDSWDSSPSESHLQLTPYELDETNILQAGPHSGHILQFNEVLEATMLRMVKKSTFLIRLSMELLKSCRSLEDISQLLLKPFEYLGDNREAIEGELSRYPPALRGAPWMSEELLMNLPGEEDKVISHLQSKLVLLAIRSQTVKEASITVYEYFMEHFMLDGQFPYVASTYALGPQLEARIVDLLIEDPQLKMVSMMEKKILIDLSFAKVYESFPWETISRYLHLAEDEYLGEIPHSLVFINSVDFYHRMQRLYPRRTRDLEASFMKNLQIRLQRSRSFRSMSESPDQNRKITRYLNRIHGATPPRILLGLMAILAVIITFLFQIGPEVLD